VGAFELRNVRNFFKINLDQTVAVYNNNLDYKVVKFIYTYLFL